MIEKLLDYLVYLILYLVDSLLILIFDMLYSFNYYVLSFYNTLYYYLFNFINYVRALNLFAPVDLFLSAMMLYISWRLFLAGRSFIKWIIEVITP